MAFTAEGPRAVVLRGDDTVAVAARPLPRGFLLNAAAIRFEIREPIGLGHKVALADIAPGEAVRKYGQIIGFASKAIAAGVLGPRPQPARPTCSSATTRLPASGPPVPARRPAKDVPRLPPARRPGRHAELYCGDQHRELLGEHVALHCRPFPGRPWRTRVSQRRRGVRDYSQGGLRACRSRGSDHKILERVLAGFANHPNVAAYVIVGLGCEVGYAQHLVEAQELSRLEQRRGTATATAGPRPRVLNIQEEGGITRTVEAAARAVYRALARGEFVDRD